MFETQLRQGAGLAEEHAVLRFVEGDRGIDHFREDGPGHEFYGEAVLPIRGDAGPGAAGDADIHADRQGGVVTAARSRGQNPLSGGVELEERFLDEDDPRGDRAREAGILEGEGDFLEEDGGAGHHGVLAPGFERRAQGGGERGRGPFFAQPATGPLTGSGGRSDIVNLDRLCYDSVHHAGTDTHTG